MSSEEVNLFHDNRVYGFYLDMEAEVFESNLIIEIDHILKWDCLEDACRFKVVPARLIFSDVTDLRLSIDWGKSGFRNSHAGMAIVGLTKTAVEKSGCANESEYFHWVFEFTDEQEQLELGASGYRLEYLAEPVWSQEQYIERSKRMGLIKDSKER